MAQSRACEYATMRCTRALDIIVREHCVASDARRCATRSSAEMTTSTDTAEQPSGQRRPITDAVSAKYHSRSAYEE
jgi:hypothetical protein